MTLTHIVIGGMIAAILVTAWYCRRRDTYDDLPDPTDPTFVPHVLRVLPPIDTDEREDAYEHLPDSRRYHHE